MLIENSLLMINCVTDNNTDKPLLIQLTISLAIGRPDTVRVGSERQSFYLLVEEMRNGETSVVLWSNSLVSSMTYMYNCFLCKPSSALVVTTNMCLDEVWMSMP